MKRHLELGLAIAACVTTLISATLVVENRYARAVVVQQKLDDVYARLLKLRILEIQLQAPPLSSADRALLEHMQQELREATID